MSSALWSSRYSFASFREAASGVPPLAASPLTQLVVQVLEMVQLVLLLQKILLYFVPIAFESLLAPLE